MKYKKYLETFIILLILILISNLICTILGYFNILSETIIKPLNLFLTLFSLFISGFHLGKRCEKKGWLEGLKIGIAITILFFLISYLGFDQRISFKNILYYLLLFVAPIPGSIMGINKKESN